MVKEIFYGVVGNMITPYIIAIITGLLTIIAQILARLNFIKSESASFFTFFILGVALIVYGLLKIYEYHRKRINEMLNPYLFVKNETIECEITKERGCVRKDTIIIEALKDGVEEYKFQVFKTAAEGTNISGLDGTKLAKILDCKTNTEYKVEFSPLKKGNEYEYPIKLRWDVKDLSCAPYISRSFHTCRGFRSVKIVILFPNDDIPERVYAYKYYSATRKRIGNPIELNLIKNTNHPGKTQVVWIFGKDTPDKPDSRHSYTIEWDWKEKNNNSAGT